MKGHPQPCFPGQQLFETILSHNTRGNSISTLHKRPLTSIMIDINPLTTTIQQLEKELNNGNITSVDLVKLYLGAFACRLVSYA
jgi:hypothetical protein